MSKSVFEIIPIPALTDNYIYAIVDITHQNAAIVDPGVAAPVIDFLNKQSLKLTGILITHHHWDHTGGIEGIIAAFPAPVYGPANENIPFVSRLIHHDDVISLHPMTLSLRIMSIPGHTIGHVAYLASGMLFCGDTLFSAGCGRLFEGTPAQMYHSLQLIAALPDTTQIYCAHEYTLNNLRFAAIVEPHNQDIDERIRQVKSLRDQGLPSLPSTLHDEKATNPFLRCHSPEIRDSVEKHTGQTMTSPVDIFAALRLWKNQF